MTYYEKNKERCLEQANNYYKKHKKEILAKMKDKYFNTRKKTAVCKVCGAKMPKEYPGQRQYCDKCINKPAKGKEAFNKAMARYLRKKRLTNKKKNCNI